VGRRAGRCVVVVAAAGLGLDVRRLRGGEAVGGRRWGGGGLVFGSHVGGWFAFNLRVVLSEGWVRGG
jgi:hypothetical protein